MVSGRAKKQQFDMLHFYSKFVLKMSLLLLFSVSLFFCFSKIKTYFPIKSVRVFGVQHIAQDRLQYALTPLVNKGFFSVDVETIKDRLLQSPWVSKAVVQRVWPGQVLITLIEKKPMARWNSLGLLSSNGELFTPEENTGGLGLPQFVGAEGQHLEMMHYYLKMSALLSTLHFKIKRLELTPEHAWNVTLDNGVKLGLNNKDVLTRMNHFVKVYPKVIGSRMAEVEYIDLRYQNGLAVRWKTIT